MNWFAIGLGIGWCAGALTVILAFIALVIIGGRKDS